MSITMNTSNSALFLQTETAQGLKTMGVAKDQMELEGKMALQLIQSANVVAPQQASSSSTLGGTVNISV